MTLNAAELQSLLALATENGVFFMEAMWTRFLPLARAFKAVLEEGKLGPPISLHADLSRDFDIESASVAWPLLSQYGSSLNVQTSRRTIGFWILDLGAERYLICMSHLMPQVVSDLMLPSRNSGPYPMVWVSLPWSLPLWRKAVDVMPSITKAVMAMYEHPDNKGEAPGHIAASMLKTPITGVDATTTFVLTFNNTLQAQAVLSCSIALPTPRPAGLVRFRNGNIEIQAPIYRPGAFTVEYFDKPGSGNVVNSETKEFSYIEGGWHFQADEVARCIRDGKLESSEWGHDKSLLVMKVFDEVRI